MKSGNFNKLFELARLDDESLENIIKDDEMVDEINSATSEHFTKMINEWKEARRKYQAHNAQLSEENKSIKAEIEVLKKNLSTKEESIKNAIELERLYGGKASLLKDKRRALDLAREHLALCQRYLKQCNIDVDDPPTLQKELIGVIELVNYTVDEIKLNYGDVFLSQTGIEA